MGWRSDSSIVREVLAHMRGRSRQRENERAGVADEAKQVAAVDDDRKKSRLARVKAELSEVLSFFD